MAALDHTAHESISDSGSVQQPRQGHQNVLSRLQGLFPVPPSPSSSSPQHDATEDPPTHPQIRRPTSSGSRFLKVRIVTWNMHDSVPKGDLEVLLGSVSSHIPLVSSPDEPVFPNLAADASHPYHIVVVASQECPSLSGIPMGLGAGFKLVDKDKDWDKDRDKEKERAKDRDKDYDKPRSKPRDTEKDESGKLVEEYSPEIPPSASGWTSTIENWLCYGSGAVNNPNSLAVPSPKHEALGVSPKALSTGDISQRVISKDLRRGPYQLLVKERMMGIYMAVYINRDIRGLVRGTSRDAVTAGLLKGRVGNKGGVGISINLDGTTLLFMNAHLAAHEDKVHHRLANFAKIKSELSVDAFLDKDDPRIMAEDLTDKFDYTFLCGDLNFRLNVSRLHADWLISREEYAQALAFDQLRTLMENGEAFVGFNEAPINFPPTFKYDVMRTVKRRKSRRSIRYWRPGAEKRQQLSEVEEKENGVDSFRDGMDEAEGDDDEGGEAASLASSVWTSVHSRVNTDVEDEEDYFHSSPSSQVINTPESAAQKLSITYAARRAKTKWKALLSPSYPGSPGKWLRGKATTDAHFLTPTDRAQAAIGSVDISKTATDPRSGSSPSPGRSSPLHPSMARPTSTKSSSNQSDEENEGNEKGVYDSSHKKRVPSWCDRILWKSTVEPDPQPGEESFEILGFYRPRTRMGQLIAQAFRPSSTRTRKESLTSITSIEGPPVPPKAPAVFPSALPPGEDVLDAVTPFSRSASGHQPPRKLHHSKSIESFPVTERPPLPRQSSHSIESRLRRPVSAAPSYHLHSVLTTEPRLSASLTPPPVNGNATDVPPPVPPKDLTQVTTPSPRWRFFPNFLAREPAHSLNSQDKAPTLEAKPAPRKGDVVCLGYDTLDDKSMRRLEGRSDHRPVIGSYAVYL